MEGKDRRKFVPSLSVRKLDVKVYKELRLRAAKHGVSMEEEARRIISQAVAAPEKFSDVFQKHFGPENGIDLDFLDQRNPHSPMEFS
jgi:antitoxin FitA